MNPIHIYRTILSTAGEQAPVLKRCLRDSVIAASLQGASFALLVPICLALGAGNNRAAVLWLLALTALLILSSIFRWRAQDYDYHGNCARADDTMRRHLGEHLRRIPLQILYRQRSGELNALLAGTIDETYNHTLIVSNMLIAAVFTPLATALITLIWDWRLGLILLISFPLIVPIQHGTQPLMARAKARLARANASLNAELLEYSQGLPVLKAANSAGTRLPRLQQAIGAVKTIQRDALLAEALPNALLGSAVWLLILLAGMVWLTGGSLDAWLLAALMVACIRFAEPLGQILSMSSIYSMVQQGYARLQELLAVAPLERVGEAAAPTRHDISFENVHYHYDANPEPVLRGINLHIPERALTALVGHSGCGKTTLIRLIMRYADPQQGRVLIGGSDIRALTQQELMRQISVVFQDVYLFDDTIGNNIRLGKADATDAEIEAAARAARCHDFIMAMPQGYQTRVGDIGGKLSGDERQRITIARAILQNRPVLILDEATGFADAENEALLMRALAALMQDKTVLMIAHRLATIRHAAQILVFDLGQLVEQGDHASLIAQNGRYARLWQAGKAARHWRIGSAEQ